MLVLPDNVECFNSHLGRFSWNDQVRHVRHEGHHMIIRLRSRHVWPAPTLGIVRDGSPP